MSNHIDPFTDGVAEQSVVVDAEAPINNRLGMSNVRQALGRWWLMLMFGILGYLGALYYMSISPPSNEAVAVLELDIKIKKLIGEGLTKENNTPKVMMATIISKMTSNSILTEVASSPEVQALQSVVPPEFSFVPRYWRTEEELRYKPAVSIEAHDMVSLIAGNLTIAPRRGTMLMDVKIAHPDPDSARVIVDTLISVYLEKIEAQLAGGSKEAYQTLKDEAEAAKAEMKAANKSFQVYSSALALNSQIESARQQILALRGKYKSKHPKMIQGEVLYADILERFKREIKRSAETASEKSHWLEHKESLESLEAVIASGGDVASAAADEWVALAQNALSSRANLLKSSIEREKQQYNVLSSRMTEIDVGGDNAMNNLLVIEPAFIGLSKSSQRLIYLAVGSIMGALAGFAIAYSLSVIDYKIYDVRSAEEATGLTCMAAIPSSTKFEKGEVWESILTSDASSANSESIRNLRASIVLLGKQERNKVLLVTSSIPGEGKTTISAEIAGAFAMNKEKTLLIDLDLRRPKLTENFSELKGKKGIVDVFAGQVELEDVFHDTNIEQLTVIGSGSKCPNPSELLHEDDFVELIERLTPQYDRIIIDSAPVLPVSDSRLLAKHVHKIILVVRSRKTPVGAIVRAKSLLELSGGKIAGVVVNGMKRSTGGSYFNGYKGYGEYGGDDYGYYGEND